MRVKASEVRTAKLYDFKCPDCDVVFEEMATWDEIKKNQVRHGKCKSPSERVMTAIRIDRDTAAQWRR
jgi:putative FmdB family regulatory protein